VTLPKPDHPDRLVRRVARIVEYNSGGPQQEYVQRETVKIIASGAGEAPEAVVDALDQAVEDGLLRTDDSGRRYAYAGGEHE
jgi:hypothetical protein